MNIVTVENLKRYYTISGKKKTGGKIIKAVDGISFEIEKGEIFGFLGPNGAGKTTTIKVLSTLLLPTSGKVKILGMDVERDFKKIRKKINVIYGGERGVYSRLTGYQNLLYFGELYGIEKKLLKTQIIKYCEFLGLKDAINRKVEEYSRGMKQKLHIIRGLINDPEILFMDEPTIGLDPEVAIKIRTLVKHLKSKGITIFLTSHYLMEIDELCNRIAIINKGKLVELGKPEDIKKKTYNFNIIEVVLKKNFTEVINEFVKYFKNKIIEKSFDQIFFTAKLSSDNIEKDVNEIKNKVDSEVLISVLSKTPTLEDAYLKIINESEIN